MVARADDVRQLRHHQAAQPTNRPCARASRWRSDPSASTFIWEKNSPLNAVPGEKFSVTKNALAMDFALRAITAQPVQLPRRRDPRRLAHLLLEQPRSSEPGQSTNRYEFAYATTHWISPTFLLGHNRTVASDQLKYGGVTSTRAVEPFAGWMRGYQRVGYLRGTLLGVLLLVGPRRVIRSWRGGAFRRLDGWGGPGPVPVGGLGHLAAGAGADRRLFAQRYVLIGAAGGVPGGRAGVHPARPGRAPAAGGRPGARGAARRDACSSGRRSGAAGESDARQSANNPGWVAQSFHARQARHAR